MKTIPILEIEALVSTTSVREQTPKLTVEQRAIAALCHEILSIAEVSAQLHLPLGVVRILVGDMADEHLVMVHRRPRLATVPTWLSWSGCCTGSTPSDGHVRQTSFGSATARRLCGSS
jgi:hypothetical protein